MVNYLILRDESFQKLRIIEPIEYTCSVGLSSSAANDIQFKLPLSDELIPVGYFVTYFGTIFGGRIQTRDIDVKSKTVTYKGKSLYGILDNLIAEWGTTDRTMKIASETYHPGCQHSLVTGSEWWENYPNNSPYGLFNFVCNRQHLNFGNTLEDVFGGFGADGALIVEVPLGTSIGGLVELFCGDIKGRKYRCYVKLSNTNILHFYWGAPKTVNLVIGYSDDSIYITDSLKISAIIDKSTMHFIKPDGTYDSKAIANVTDSDLKYKGVAQIQEWNPNDDSNGKNQQRLKALREDNNGRIATTISKIISGGESEIDAEIGDYINVVYREMGVKYEGKVCEKVLTYKGGFTKIEYILG